MKVGDKVRYLGGDSMAEGELMVGKEYVIEGTDEAGNKYFHTDDGRRWYVISYNAHCFEKVDEKKTELDLIANLAQEVAKLKREISDLRSAMHAQSYEDNERIERILDDIVMLDERTQGVSITEAKPVRKVVYEYERYYD